MKKLYLLTSIAMGALLLFATMAWAGEASVFDDAQGLLIRAYTAPGTTSGNALYLQVYDSSGNPLDASKVNVTGLTPTTTPLNRNIPLPPATIGPPYTAEYILHDNNATLNLDISLSYDTSFHTAFLFCTDPGLMVMKYDIVSLLPIAGVCGTPSGGPFASAPTTGLCSAGTPMADPVENTSTGQWTWICQGQNNGANSGTCSALAIVPGACGTPSGAPFTTAPTSGLCTTGTATLPVVNTGTAFWTWDCVGLNGGSRAVGCSATASIPGACGTASGQSFTSAPTTNLCNPGTANPTPSGAGPWSWVCAGPNGGANSPQCSASVQSSGTHDLDFTRYYGMVYGITSSGCTTNGGTCSVSLSIVNNGNGPAGNFNVKYWISGSPSVDANAQLIGTWNVPGLAAGQTLAGTISGTFSNLPVHNYYYLIIKIDADNQVTESNETNNTQSIYGNYVYR